MDCLHEDCPAVATGRGLCRRHLAMAKQLVRRYEVTWTELEYRGLAMPPDRARSAAAHTRLIQGLPRRPPTGKGMT